MKNYEIDHLVRELKTSTSPLVLFGAKKFGALAYHALNKLGIKENYICDDSEEVREKKFFINTSEIKKQISLITQNQYFHKTTNFMFKNITNFD